MEIREGMNIRFSPAGWSCGANGAPLDAWLSPTVDGVIERINREKGWMRIRYVAKGDICHECIKLPILPCERIKKIWG